MKKYISACLFFISTMCLAVGGMSTLRNHVPEFSETATFLEGEDVKTFRMVDINGDEQVDLLWKTSEGDIKYQIHVPKEVLVC